MPRSVSRAPLPREERAGERPPARAARTQAGAYLRDSRGGGPMHMRWFGVAALCAACGAATQPPPASEQPAEVVADRVSVDYAEVSPGESSEVPVRFTNPGTSAVGALHAAIGGADPAAFAVTSDGCAQGALAPAATCEVRIAFRPAEE